MSESQSSGYDVRIWTVSTYRGKRGTTYTVRWRVTGKRHRATFQTMKLAESFRSKLLVAAREGRPFEVKAGLPATMVGRTQQVTWYEHAGAFMDLKWVHASPRHRKGLAEGLVDVTQVLVTDTRGAPDIARVRTALFRWSFNTSARGREPASSATPPEEMAQAVRWIQSHSVPLSQLAESATLRRALNAISTKADGTAAAPATVMRKRSALFSALAYAVELELLPTNPMERIATKRATPTGAVDRRVVVNPTQARALLAAVRGSCPSLEAFFACLYFAGLRPGEARHLREQDCTLPEQGWGSLLLVGSSQPGGRGWTDSGEVNEDRQLKHRAARDTRPVPASPDLVSTLRRHIELFPPAPDGRLFVTRVGRGGHPDAAPFSRPVAMGTVYRVWHATRESALTPEELRSPLARRPYDLRHACVSLWLNSGVPATQVAAWARHSVNVLLRVYATCISDQEESAIRRVQAALDPDEPS